MTVPKRWIRLDVTWSDSDWLVSVQPCAQLAWIQLLCYVKTTGCRGVSRPLSAFAASRKWGLPEDAVSEMLNAAEAHGALDTGEGWRIVKWVDYQEPDGTAAERQRRYRADRSRLSPLRRDGVTSHVTPVSNGVTRRVTETETETVKERALSGSKETRSKKRKTALPEDWQPNDTHRERAERDRLNLDREASLFRDHHAANGSTFVDWDRAFSKWLGMAQNFAPATKRQDAPAPTAQPFGKGGYYVGG